MDSGNMQSMRGQNVGLQGNWTRINLRFLKSSLRLPLYFIYILDASHSVSIPTHLSYCVR